MKILLISPNRLTVPYPVYPIGLDYVAGAVPPGHQVRIADLNVLSMAQLELLLADYAPDVIGLSCRNLDNTDATSPLPFIDDYRQLVDWLRHRSTALIVCGGSGFTIMPEALLTVLGADYGIAGEGERFGPFIEALSAGRDVADLAGVVSAGRPALAPPPWDGAQIRAFDATRNHHRFYLENGGMLNLQSKRGCTFRCIYCSYPHIEGGRHRLLPAAEVAKTALHLQESGARYLFFTDSAFNSEPLHSLEIAKAFKADRISIPWGGFFAPLAPPPDYYAILQDAGLRHVEFGTESLSDPMLRAYRKPFNSRDVLLAHEQARHAGLHIAHYFLFGGPGETNHTVTESLERAQRLERTVLFFFVGIRIYPNTGLYELARSEGQITEETDLLEPVYYKADAINCSTVEKLVRNYATGRSNWVIGSGGEHVAAMMRKMYQRKRCGPLWEYIIG